VSEVALGVKAGPHLVSKNSVGVTFGLLSRISCTVVRILSQNIVEDSLHGVVYHILKSIQLTFDLQSCLHILENEVMIVSLSIATNMISKYTSMVGVDLEHKTVADNMMLTGPRYPLSMGVCSTLSVISLRCS
jgi:hypothetical protein